MINVFTEISDPGENRKTIFTVLLCFVTCRLLDYINLQPSSRSRNEFFAEFNRRESATSGSCLFDPPGGNYLVTRRSSSGNFARSYFRGLLRRRWH